MEDRVVLDGSFLTELDIVNAARVSYDRERSVFDPRSDGNLLKFLLKNNHKSPFYMPVIKFHFKMPIFVARQWFRHHIGFARNEMSRRYVEKEPEFWRPGNNTFRAANQENPKKGSDPSLIINDDSAIEEYGDAIWKASETYRFLIGMGVSREQARAVLPQATYTEFIEIGSLWAYINLIKERTSPGAQEEIREYAEAVKEILRELYPVTINFLFPK